MRFSEELIYALSYIVELPYDGTVQIDQGTILSWSYVRPSGIVELKVRELGLHYGFGLVRVLSSCIDFYDAVGEHEVSRNAICSFFGIPDSTRQYLSYTPLVQIGWEDKNYEFIYRDRTLRIVPKKESKVRYETHTSIAHW